MKITPAQAAWLASGVAQESASHGFAERRPWLETSLRSLLASTETPSFADLAAAALRAAANSEHRTPAGIRHELERLLAAAERPAPSSSLARMPAWEPEPKTDACPPPPHMLARVRNLRAHTPETPAPAEPRQRPAASR